MALHLGFDPGGTGRKIAYVTAAVDDDDRLFVGRLADPALGIPGFQSAAYPYLPAPAVASIEARIDAALREVLALTGPALPASGDPCAAAIARHETVFASVDACSGFATPGQARRDTEGAVGANFNTPDESTFLRTAAGWASAGNLTPLHQRVFWKLIGFAVFSYFTRSRAAAHLARAATSGLLPGAVQKLPSATGLRVFESFPSETYRATNGPARAVLNAFAARTVVPLQAAPIHVSTQARFTARLRAVAGNQPGAWARIPGRPVGDCLDAFASMMLGPWATTTGVRARCRSPRLMQLEGAIVVPS